VSGFAYRDGILHADGVALTEIADQVGTPTYVYSAATIAANYHAYEAAFAGQSVDIHFALKANGNLAVVALLASLGAGADIVSAGELERALAAGIAPGRIVFSGVGKTRQELAAAIRAGVGQINVESEPEIDLLDEVARGLGRPQRIALRINPDVDAHTHDKISTGKRGDKFGIPYDHAIAAYQKAAGLPGLEPVGVAAHIGSQLIELDPFRSAYRKVAALVQGLRAAGLAVDAIDLGGGVGVAYQDETPPPLEDYAALVCETVGNLGCRLAIEPGRSIVANAGVLLSRVIYRKSAAPHDIIILDAAMNDLMRPSLYDSRAATPLPAPAPCPPSHPKIWSCSGSPARMVRAWRRLTMRDRWRRRSWRGGTVSRSSAHASRSAPCSPMSASRNGWPRRRIGSAHEGDTAGSRRPHRDFRPPIRRDLVDRSDPRRILAGGDPDRRLSCRGAARHSGPAGSPGACCAPRRVRAGGHLSGMARDKPPADSHGGRGAAPPRTDQRREAPTVRDA
jgi:diaminopimelate decarboxylase